MSVKNNTFRFGETKKIDLVSYLPEHLQESETYDFVVMFEEFLNDLYTGDAYVTSGDYVITDNEGVTSGTYGSTEVSATTATDISILEKIKRITELHDADLIDIDYIQYFASYLGYSITLNRDDVLSDVAEGAETEDLKDKYIRQAVRDLPHWYKIKSTDDCFKVMLYSFGLATDLYQWYTRDYLGTSGDVYLKGFDENDTSKSLVGFYSSPHFAIAIDVDDTLPGYVLDGSQQSRIVDAILAIKPINTVFSGLIAWFERTIPAFYVNRVLPVNNLYITINGYSSEVPLHP